MPRLSHAAALSAALLCIAGAAPAHAASAALRFCDQGPSLTATEQDRLLRFAAVVKDELDAAGPAGTARLAQVPGYSIGGKSGTAHKQEGRGYTNKYRSWFVGVAPINKPRIVVAVMVDEPTAGVYYGGAVAGPVFSQVTAQTLRLMGVAPDLDVKSQIVANQKAVPVEESF